MLLFRPVRLRGTFPPFARASLNAIAIACLRLVTFRPPRVFNVPLFFRWSALLTRFDADFPYFRPDDFRPDDFRPDFRAELFRAVFRDVFLVVFRAVFFLADDLRADFRPDFRPDLRDVLRAAM